MARVLHEAASVLEKNASVWPFTGPTLATAAAHLTAAEARFMHAIPSATLAVLASRPVRPAYLDRMRALLGEDAQRLRAVGGNRDLVPVLGEDLLHQAARGGIVVDDQDSRRLRHGSDLIRPSRRGSVR